MIKLDVQQSFILQEMKDMKDNLVKRVTELENKPPSAHEWSMHLDKDNDHENRIRGLEIFKENLQGRLWVMGSAIGAVATIISLVVEKFWIK